MNSKHFKKWVRLLKTHQEQKLLELLKAAPAVEVADFLAMQPIYKLIALLISLPANQQGIIFSEFLDEDLQIKIYSLTQKNVFALIFSNMPSDQRVDFYQKLDSKEHTKLLPYLNKKIREDVITLSAYRPNTAGGIMSTDFATVTNHMTVEEALAKIREDSPSKKMIFYIYVVDEHFHMLGVISLKDLIMAQPHTSVVTFLQKNFVYADLDSDKERVARQIEKYDLLAIPILNYEKQIVGIVNYDDAMDIIREEETEDMEKFMGIISDDESTNYLKLSSLYHLKTRIRWIIILFFTGLISFSVMHHYVSIFETLPFLSMYLPMINDTGGNIGSQSASVIIRAMALSQINLHDWAKVIIKELKVALVLAVILFLLTYLKVSFSSSIVGIVKHGRIPLTVALALSLQVIISTLIGALLPLIAKYFKGDPAIAASPAITTCVDITGTIIYFQMLHYLLF